jgi:hypothetical protein
MKFDFWTDMHRRGNLRFHGYESCSNTTPTNSNISAICHRDLYFKEFLPVILRIQDRDLCMWAVNMKSIVPFKLWLVIIKAFTKGGRGNVGQDISHRDCYPSAEENTELTCRSYRLFIVQTLVHRLGIMFRKQNARHYHNTGSLTKNSGISLFNTSVKSKHVPMTFVLEYVKHSKFIATLPAQCCSFALLWMLSFQIDGLEKAGQKPGPQEVPI